jgi:hypothetical protein
LTSYEKTYVPSLIANIRSDLFTLDNISKSVKLMQDESLRSDDVLNMKQWDTVISYIPMDFYRLIESFPDMYTVEKFDMKYAYNPKMCAYERYNTTNMWRPLMILNRCPSITKFDFDFIRYYNPQLFSQVLSVLISRVQES